MHSHAVSQGGEGAWWERHRYAILVIALVAGALYANTIPGSFVYDDRGVILKNQLIRDVENIPTIFVTNYWSIRAGASWGLYRPLVITSYAVDYLFGGLDPTGYHVVNVLLHALASVLVYWTCLLVLGHRSISFLVALLFAVHPIHTEAVANIVGRAELFSAVFVLLGWVGYIYSRSASTRSGRWYALSLVAFFLGLLSKENAIALIGVLVVYDLVLRRELTRTGPWLNLWLALRRRYLPYLIVIVGYLLLRHVALAGTQAVPTSPLANPLVSVDIAQRILTALSVVGRYILILVLPVRLSADYSYNQIPITSSLLDPSVALTLLVLAGALVVAVRWAPTRKGPLLGFCFFWLTFAPMANLFFPIGTIMGERFMYLPSVGFLLWVAGVGEGLVSRWRERAPGGAYASRVAVALVCVVVALWSVRTVIRNADWRDNITLFAKTAQASPRSARAHCSLGMAYQQEKRYDEAIAAFVRALEIAPRYSEAYSNLANAYKGRGDYDKAISAYRRALQINPRHTMALVNLGTIYLGQQKYDEAIAFYRRAIEVNPSSAEAHGNIGMAYFAMDRVDDAIGELRKALALNPYLPEVHSNLGACYFKKGMNEYALGEYRRALELNPALVETRTNLGMTYLRLGVYDLAERELKQAVALAPQSASTNHLLGTAYLALGMPEEAIPYFETATSLNPSYAKGHDALGTAYLRLERLEEAEAAFGRAVAVEPSYAEGYIHLGEVYERQGKTAEAAEALARYEALTGELP